MLPCNFTKVSVSQLLRNNSGRLIHKDNSVVYLNTAFDFIFSRPCSKYTSLIRQDCDLLKINKFCKFQVSPIDCTPTGSAHSIATVICHVMKRPAPEISLAEPIDIIIQEGTLNIDEIRDRIGKKLKEYLQR